MINSTSLRVVFLYSLYPQANQAKDVHDHLAFSANAHHQRTS